MDSLLKVNDLTVTLGVGANQQRLVEQVGFTLEAGQILSIVGESGSGKSLTAKAIAGLLPPAVKASGEVIFRRQNLLSEEVSSPLGTGIGLVFQEPMTALTPVLTVGLQLTEAMLFHGLADRAEANARAIEMLERVGIPAAAARMSQYPHELSGGMRQRVMIAMMMLLQPQILIADEPTTALDVTVQAQILDLLRDIVTETGIGLILITHDMGVVAELADDVLVLRRGAVVEAGTTQRIFASPEQPYTQELLAAVPRLDNAPPPPSHARDRFAPENPLVSVKNVTKTFRSAGAVFASGHVTQALDDVSLSIEQGETLALVGESGSGKSTLGRVIARLVEADAGAVQFDGRELLELQGAALRRVRPQIQVIFQDPYASLDPRHRIASTITEPVAIRERISRAARLKLAAALLARVGLDEDMAMRYPHEFSGGQRQRIAIARALAANPKLIIADEPTSALDVSIQAQILELLASLQREEGLTVLFISHDLAVVRQIADRVAVMRQGRIVEMGPVETVWKERAHPYTQALIAAAPIPDPERRRGTHAPMPGTFAKGPLVEQSPGHWAAL